MSMKPSFHKKRGGGLWIIAITFLGLSLVWADPGWGASGLSLNLYTLQESHKFSASQPIPIIGVIKNETKWPLNMDLGFSQMEIERYLIARDPQGVRHTPPFQEIQASDMPPPSKWGKYDTVPAEVLPPGWQRSVDIDDLRELFPVMERLSGWYTIEAELPLSRYGWTVKEEASDRLLGVLDNKAWHGTIKSKKLRIFVAPARGGRMKIRVEDLSTPELTARSNVEIKVFKKSEVLGKDNLADAWASLEPTTRGNTGQGGWVTLPAGGSCLPEPAQDDAYVAIAKYKGEYKEAYLEQGAAGWQTECGGLLTRYILFGEPPHQFSVFGLCSVWLRNKVRIESGDVGANTACAGPWLDPEFEVSVDVNAWTADGNQIKGDSVQIRSTASVYEVFYNDLNNLGTIRFHDEDITYTPLTVPIWNEVEDLFPKDNEFKASNDSKDKVIVETSLNLSPGAYNDVILGSNTTLILSGGQYDFMNLELGSDSVIVCQDPTIIRIKERLYPGTKSYLGPQAGSTITAGDIKIYVNGTNGKKGGLNDKPKAAQIGEGNTIKANIYAKNGTLLIEEGCNLEGSFIAKDVSVGQKSVVNFKGAF
jgi:hypothetical protein